MSDAAPRPGSAAAPTAGRLAIDAVVTHHLDGFRSGTARFNELLAARLGVPLAGLHEPLDFSCPLLSFRASELGRSELATVEGIVERRGQRWELFLHEFGDKELERRLVAGAQRVHCGNREIEAAVRPLNASVSLLWTPGLLTDDRSFRPAEVSVFSFGMAHKIRTDAFARLRALLESSGRSYAVYVSAANHETSSMRDAESVFAEMHKLFPDKLYFLGNLSDVAVHNWLRQTTFFAAFFEKGVRANNTSVASAMERGAVVVTNLDEYSPLEYVHMENVIDIAHCEELPADPLMLRRISVRAMETARARGWTSLVELF
jgi:hypothetical protein